MADAGDEDDVWLAALASAKMNIEAGLDLCGKPLPGALPPAGSAPLDAPGGEAAPAREAGATAAATASAEEDANALAQQLLATLRFKEDVAEDGAEDGAEADTASGGKLLILLDMNGTLLHRSKTVLGGAARKADLSLGRGKGGKGIHYYFRPGARELVRTVCALGDHVSVGFYTSMQVSNAAPAVAALTGERENASLVYPREFNVKDPRGENPWDTHRDLQRVWACEGKVGHGFGATNTIMVDDTPRKMRHMPRNALLVPEFGEEAVERGGDAVLPDVLEYLVSLAAARPADVRDYMEMHPPPSS